MVLGKNRRQPHRSELYRKTIEPITKSNTVYRNGVSPRRKKHSIGEICARFGITKPTLYAYMREAESHRMHPQHAG
jgi:hypothetical protein